MILRDAKSTLHRLAKGFPAVVVTGPRQSGKTTLCKDAFPNKPYLSLENPDTMTFASSDPRRFLDNLPDGAVIDEAQRVPDLFSYLQGRLDDDGRMGLFVLTGSQQFGLLSRITQSLAGRTGLVQLLPFSLRELSAAGKAPSRLDTLLLKGLYPPVHARNVAPSDWHANYSTTYLERDVRQIINVRDLGMFRTFLRMCAARTGQTVNLSALAADCGVTHNTAKAWISVLESSYIVMLLRPHHRNFGKRLVKTPKLHFLDTGLAAHLLGIRSEEQMRTHPMRGALFESFVVGEFVKRRWNRGEEADLFFWRDAGGIEVDLVVEDGTALHPVEIKSGATVADDFFDGIQRFRSVAGKACGKALLVYGGEKRQNRDVAEVCPWKEI